MIKTENRRKFMKVLGLGAIGTSLFSLNPKSLFSKSSNSHNHDKPKIEVNLHPSAIKRNKKGKV